jgi:hypothetical protein
VDKHMLDQSSNKQGSATSPPAVGIGRPIIGSANENPHQRDMSRVELQRLHQRLHHYSSDARNDIIQKFKSSCPRKPIQALAWRAWGVEVDP